MSTGVDEWLATLRGTPRYHWLAMIAACVAGLVLASVHWVGLVAGGALVGLMSTTLRRALLAGLGFGALVLLAWASLLAWHGALGGALVTGRLAGLGVAMALVAPVLGSLVRGVV